MAAKSSSKDIKITRIYDAPVKLVWEAWTDPKKAAKWWGPRGFTLTTHSKDLRVGGSWVYTMHGPDGVDYPNITVYHEVEEFRRLVYDHGANETQPALFRVTVNFSEKNGKTTMDMTMTLPTPEAATEARKFVKKAGGNATWDRLAEYLEKESSGQEKFVINRSFEAPIEKVFEAWANTEQLAQWLPPTGMTAQFARAEVKPGSSAFFSMTNGSDIKMYGRIEYLEVVRPHRLVYTQQFCDENQKTSRHPMEPNWPETMLTTVQFEAEGPEETRVTVTWQPHGTVTPKELAVFIKERGGMTQGWTGSFDKLDTLLEKK